MNIWLRRILIILILLFPLVMLIPGFGDFAYPVGSQYSDITITHFPNLVYLKHSLIEWHQIPLWSNAIMSGYPFIANPLSGLWYLPQWLTIILPYPFGFNLLILFHLLWGGLGMYLLLRTWKFYILASIIGALMFELMPKILAHYAAGHLTLVFAVTWTPWLILAQVNSMSQYGRKKRFIYPAIVFAIIIFADIRWAAFSFILWLFWIIDQIYTQQRSETQSGVSKYIFKNINGKTIINLGKDLLIALLLTSPFLFMLIQYTRLTTRASMQIADNLALSLPFKYLLGYLFPDLGGYCEWIVYPGAIAIVSLIITLFIAELRKKNKFWLLMICITVVLSLGSQIPLISWIWRIPGFNLLRVPPRFQFITGFCFAIITASCAHYLMLHQQAPKDGQYKYLRLFLVGLKGFAIILASGIWIIIKELPLEFIWGAVALAIITTILMSILSENKRVKAFHILLIPLVVFDIAGVGYSQINYLSNELLQSESKNLANYLSSLAINSRIYSPSNSIPQHIGALYHLQLSNGIDPMQLSAYVNYFARASGVPDNGYSVTIPRFATGNPDFDNQAYTPNAVLLGLLNVKYVISAFPIKSENLTFEKNIDGQYLYINQLNLPRSWVQMSNGTIGESIISTPVITRYTANAISLQTEGPGQLVLSEISYPGWVVYLDGASVKTTRTADIFRSIDLPSGNHRVDFIFHPYPLYFGLLVASLTVLIVIIFSIKKYLQW